MVELTEMRCCSLCACARGPVDGILIVTPASLEVIRTSEGS